MSHVASIEVKITNLEALKAACAELGVAWYEGQKNYKWYGTSVGDYPLPAGMTVEMLGKCEHAIHVPGVEYEVGVVKLSDGTYTLAFDFWGPGQGLLKKFGDKLGVLTQRYGVCAAEGMAKLKGLPVNRTVKSDGSIRLEIGASSGFGSSFATRSYL